jgi:hypothetical protein
LLINAGGISLGDIPLGGIPLMFFSQVGRQRHAPQAIFNELNWNVRWAVTPPNGMTLNGIPLGGTSEDDEVKEHEEAEF